MIQMEKIEEFVSKVARVLGMFFMLLLVLVLGWNLLAYTYHLVRPIFNQKYPKTEFKIQDFKRTIPSSAEASEVDSKREVTLSEKLAISVLNEIKKDFETTLANVVRQKGIGLVRAQISEELKSLPYAELNESVEAVIQDTTPKYWQIFFEKSKERIANDLDYQFSEDSFKEDAAEKLISYLKESMKNGYSPYSLYNYQNEEVDFLTDLRQSKVYKRFFEVYSNGKSELDSKNAQDEFFTNTRLIVLGSILLLLPFLGVLFSIMRIEKHLAKR
ncbi:hypothetical protein CLV96_3860 [Leptospira meyeri]|uniref:Uncharacterized protein n=1 Tax=Leptospira meyeri TaxID=29508 RepID=A0A4R8MN49_LEPME|nr:hypothetical protein [Leptospira meyeri]EKJ85890.1 hypothetical protein LEP1GSC017_0398 [Leptospira meyeri serovar Hardjo str. Went 5]TDY66750.1 hypothetical protein CLV96_3860 [Leptospira meyeri]